MRNQLFGRLNADAMVVEIHVGELGDSAGLDHREAGGDECVAGHDDFVAGSDAERRQADVQGCGTGGRTHGVLASLPLGELLLELHALGAGPVVHLAGPQHGLDGADGVLVELGPCNQLVGNGLGAAVNGQLQLCHTCRHKIISMRKGKVCKRYFVNSNKTRLPSPYCPSPACGRGERGFSYGNL